MDIELPYHPRPADLISFATYVFQGEGNEAALDAIRAAIQNADDSSEEEGYELCDEGWEQYALRGWRSMADSAGIPDTLPGLDHPLAIDFFGAEVVQRYREPAAV